MVQENVDLLGVSGKSALVTGAASGIGLATAQLLLAQGMRVGMLDSNAELLFEIGKALEARHSGQLSMHVADVTKRDDVECAVARMLGFSSSIDLLVTAAGIVRPDSAEAGAAMMDVNLQGTLNAVHAVRPAMTRQGKGAIVLVGSIVASLGWPGRVDYCASKGAVEAAMRALALELAASGIRVNAVAPGLVWTPMIRTVVKNDPDPVAAFRFRSVQQALGAMLRPEDVARHILFLGSDLSTGLVGSVLDASGGRLAGHIPDPARPGPHFAAAWEAARREFSSEG